MYQTAPIATANQHPSNPVANADSITKTESKQFLAAIRVLTPERKSILYTLMVNTLTTDEKKRLCDYIVSLREKRPEMSTEHMIDTLGQAVF